jgi:HlyD family secretion protein
MFNDSRDDYLSSQRRAEAVRRAQSVNRRLQGSQLAQLRASNASLSGSLDIARPDPRRAQPARARDRPDHRLLDPGRPIAEPGERLGQIDSAGRNKLVAQVDEFILAGWSRGQVATVEDGGKTFKAKVAKIYPQVRNGTFEVDLHFVGAEPAELQRGQTMQVRLTLGDPTRPGSSRTAPFTTRPAAPGCSWWRPTAARR